MSVIPTRRLGKSSLELTQVGFGTWGISGGRWRFGWGEQDPQDAVDAILKAVELGINWIDTAPVYGDGISEEHVGAALQKIPADLKPLIATKCGRVFGSDGTVSAVLKRESIIQECEKSLKRLGVDVIDLYQIHWPDPEQDIEEGWRAVNDLKRAGKVREIGVSNFNVTQMKRILPEGEIASLQPPYSLMARQIEQEILPFCSEQQIGIVGYSPLAKGLLTGKMTPEYVARIPQDDHRSRDPKFHEPQLSRHLKFIKGLTTLAENYQKTLAELAIAWTLRRPEVTAAIVGARNPSQVQANIGGALWRLEEELIEKIETLQTQWQSEIAEVT